MKRFVLILIMMLMIGGVVPVLGTDEEPIYDDQYFIDMPNGFLKDEAEDPSRAISMLDWNPKLRASVGTRVIKIPFKVTNSKGNYFMWSDFSILKYQNKPAFCVDPLTKIYPQYNYHDVAFSSILNDTVREKIQLILQYGYTYEGHLTDNYYLATQKLIWEAFGCTVRFYAKNSNFTGYYRVDAEEKEIKRLIGNHTKVPSFHNQEIRLKVGETLVLTDDTEVISDYILKTVPDFLDVSVDGNHLSIYAKDVGVDEDIVFQKGVDRVDSVAITAHKASGSQTIVSMANGAVEPLISQLRVNVDGYGSFQLKKVDTETGKALEGVQFRIAEDEAFKNEVGCYTTDKDGMIQVDMLEPKTYYYQEISTIPPYCLDSTIGTFTIQINETTSIVAKNRLQKGKLKIYKQDRETLNQPQAEASLAGAEYDLLKSDKVTVVEHLVAKGQVATSSNTLDVNTVYYLKETKAPVGMECNQDLMEIVIPYNDSSSSVVEKEITYFDEVIGNRILIQKQKYTEVESKWYSRKSIPASGVRFEIYEKWSNRKVDEMICDSKGMAQSKWLPYGTYMVKEVEHEGYQLLEPFEVKIDDSNKKYEYSLFNEPLYSHVKLWKVDAKTQKPLLVPGIQFQILDENGNVLKLYNHAGECVDTFVSDETGIVNIDQPLKVGTYQIKEVQSAEGYLLLKQPVSFTVDGTQKELILPIENQAVEGQVLLYKYGDLFQGYESLMTPYGLLYHPIFQKGYLKGATFELCAATDIQGLDGTVWYRKGECVQRLLTHEDGPVVSKKLPLGRYYLVEVEAPSGYQLDTTKHFFEISDQGNQQPVVSISQVYTNQRNFHKIVFSKEFEEINGGSIDEIKNEVVFGLWNAKEQNGMEKDTLVDICEWKQRQDWYFEIPFAGEYYIKELKTHPYYQLDQNKYPVTCSEDESRIEMETIFKNYLNRGRVEVKKINEYEVPLSDVSYALAKDQSMERIVQEKKTDVNGIAVFDDLPYGTYYVKEVNAPVEYELDTQVYEVVVNQLEPLTITKVNHHKSVKIQVKKVDTDDATLVLENAEFELLNVEDQSIQIARTDAMGIAYFEIPYGTYQLKEIKAPMGYQQSEEVLTIVVNESLECTDGVYQLEYCNRKVPSVVVDTGVKNGREVLTYLFSGVWVVIFFIYRLRC